MTTFAVVSVTAAAENAVQVAFNLPVYFTGLLDTFDGSAPAVWSLVGSGVGLDGQPARSVLVLAPSIDATGQVVTLTLDRPTSPYPCTYGVLTTGVFTADFTQALKNLGSLLLLGTTPAAYRELTPAQQNVPAPGRDLANPQTLAAAKASTIARPAQAALGSFGYSDDHDYAFDQGDEGLRKRLTRRTFCRKNGFAFLRGYGAGVRDHAKKLGTAATRDRLAADCEAQYAQEPEVASSVVNLRPDPSRPGLYRLAVFVKKKTGQTLRFSTLIGNQ